jgi:hypothetical protein
VNGPVCFVDVETTGLDPDRHQIWEVALITPVVGATGADDGWNEQIWQLPVDLSRADPIALNIGRFHDRRLPPGSLVALADFAWEFVHATRGLHLVGACVSFDAERLWCLMRDAGECPMWHYHLVDVEALAAGFIAGTRATLAAATPLTGEAAWAGNPAWHAAEGPGAAPPWNSGDLSRAVGVDPDDFDRHTALGDARWAKALYEAVIGR